MEAIDTTIEISGHKEHWINQFIDMDRVDQEDWISIRRRLASETGFTGISELHRLHSLYKFDVLNDLVFDAIHTLLLNVVKRHLDYYKDQGHLSDPIVEEKLRKMPWTAGIYKITSHTRTHTYSYIIMCQK